MVILGLTDGLLAVEEVVAAFLRVSLFAVLLVCIPEDLRLSRNACDHTFFRGAGCPPIKKRHSVSVNAIETKIN